MSPHEFVQRFEFLCVVDIVIIVCLVLSGTCVGVFGVIGMVDYDSMSKEGKRLIKGLLFVSIPLFLSFVTYRIFSYSADDHILINSPKELAVQLEDWRVVKALVVKDGARYLTNKDISYVLGLWLAGKPNPVVLRNENDSSSVPGMREDDEGVPGRR